MLDDKPIATAPRDGREIMVWCDDGVWRKVRWKGDDIWITTDGEMQVRGTVNPDPTMITASIWAPVMTTDDGASQAAIASGALSSAFIHVK